MKLGLPISSGSFPIPIRLKRTVNISRGWMGLILLVLSTQFLQGQTQEAILPAYKRFPTIPPFNLLKVDSSGYLTKEDVKKNRPTMVMFFSPECEHCKHQTEDLLASMDQFKDVEIVMATIQPFNEMKEFYKYYRISDHPNIKMGRDEKDILPGFYQIHNLPYLALYDKKGNLITTFEGSQKAATLINAFKKGS
jgi:thiol-disulfide isomerase/thioredoxin